jgi:tryptophan halogenase
MGVHCKNWNGDGKSYFEPLQSSKTGQYSPDIDYLLATKYDESHRSSPMGVFWDNNLVPFPKNSYAAHGAYSYHFDAHKVGAYFKKLALENGVKHIDAEIHNLDINPNTGDLESVDLKNTNQTITADLWFDCTGFARALIGPMGGGWTSYSKHLPVNKALTYLHPYEDGEKIAPETLAWAMPNGWMWQIPTGDRYGCGYVYSDKFVTDEQAHKELEEVTGRKITPLRTISFDPGRVNEVWKNNVLSLGLASCFLEPLEATSIHGTIVQIDMFINLYLHYSKEHTFYQTARDRYNKAVARLVDDYRDLIQIHYVTKREDSEFWKYCKNDLEYTDKVKEILEICKHRSPSFRDFEFFIGASGWGVWAWILAGLGHVTPELANDSLLDNNLNIDDDFMYDKIKTIYNQNLDKYYTHNEFLADIKSGKI